MGKSAKSTRYGGWRRSGRNLSPGVVDYPISRETFYHSLLDCGKATFTTKLVKNRTESIFVENNEKNGVVDNIFAEGT